MKGPDALLFWATVNLSRCSFSFLIEGIGLDEGSIGPIARLVSDVDIVKAAYNGDSSVFMHVNKVHLITSPMMNEQTGYVMEVLAEIRLQPGTEVHPVYEFVTDAGRIYTSARS
ncbi:hypothetical protein [Pseudomonas sp. BS3782 TE3695]|uniref:hypothetical protein n=1 Tax=Pseudomonas TaxID=286 RepID=UPI003D20ED96